MKNIFINDKLINLNYYKFSNDHQDLQLKVFPLCLAFNNMLQFFNYWIHLVIIYLILHPKFLSLIKL